MSSLNFFTFFLAKPRVTAVALALLAFTAPALLRAQNERTIYFFNTKIDVFAQGGLIADSSGALYGTTTFGGSASGGDVFKLAPPAAPGASWTESVLHSFTGGNDGEIPDGSLVFDSHGNLYGTTQLGGLEGQGVIFQLVPPVEAGGDWTEHILYSSYYGEFEAGLNIDASGTLYGSTLYDIFQLVPPVETGGAWTYNQLYAMPGGSWVARNLLLDSKGNLYGTSEFGGRNNDGFVFGLGVPTRSGGRWSYSDLYDFTGGSDGGTPMSSLTLKSGPFYGTTEAGGATGFGTVYSLTPPAAPGSPWTEAVLYNFLGGTDGLEPEGGVSFGTGGTLYGTTYGGNNANGSVFKLTPPSEPGNPWTVDAVHDFSGVSSDGGQPRCNLLLLHGAFFGMTSSPSAVFEVSQ
jgi:uncharacterized repeat protein (TIGR03803 family)